MEFSTPVQRVVRGTTATLSWQPVDADGDPAEPAGTVTVEVTRADGSELLAAGTATSGSGSSPRTVSLTPAQTADLDVLTATWTDNSVAVATTTVDIVGGVYVTTARIRSDDPSLSVANDYPKPDLLRARAEVETQFERGCRRAFVPRFRVDRVSGSGTHRLEVSRPHVRRVRWARIYTTATAYTELTADELASIRGAGPESNVLYRTDSKWWPCGHRNIELGYEYGADQPPDDLKHLAVVAIRAKLNTFRSGIPDRAVSFQPVEGGNVLLATPGQGEWITGIPEVDEALGKRGYRWMGWGVR